MSTAEHTAAAVAAVQALHRLAKLEGDPEAIEALRDIALRAIGILDLLTTANAEHPDTPERIRPSVAAAHEIAKHSSRWPVAWDAIQEIRESTLGKIAKDGEGQVSRLGIGSAIGIRLEGKRGFSPHEQTGFALDVFNELEAIRKAPARHLHAADEHPELAAPGILNAEQSKRTWRNLAAVLPPLSKESVSVWADAGRELSREWCEGDWSRFPWPDCVKGKIGTVTDENGNECGGAKAVRDKIAEGLKNLF